MKNPEGLLSLSLKDMVLEPADTGASGEKLI